MSHYRGVAMLFCLEFLSLPFVKCVFYLSVYVFLLLLVLISIYLVFFVV